MKKYGWICLILVIILALGIVGCSSDAIPGNEENTTEGAPENTIESDPHGSSTNVPDDWHIFEYDGVKYDLWEVATEVNAVEEWGRIDKYVIAEGHVNPYNSVFAVINTETQVLEHHFIGSVPTYYGDDINTLVYAFWNTVMAYDGTVLAELTLHNGEYIYALSYTEDKSCIEVKIEGDGTSRRNIINLAPFDAESFFANIPAEWSQRLFWHQIRGTNDYMYFCNYRGVNSTLDGFTKDPPKRFSIYHVNSKSLDVIGYIGAEIPDDITYDTVCPVVVYDCAGSMECEFIVQLTDGDKVFYVSFDNFDWGESQDYLTFTCRGVLSEERVNELKSLYPDAFRQAEQYFWHYTLDDFKNENSGDSLVYEGYTVEYRCESPYAGTFDFHIHLPQLNSDSIYAQKWNLILKQEYDAEFGEQLRKTVHGINTEYYAHITYDTVTTGDVLTIYIVKSYGINASGASTVDYDIYHYNMKEERFLSTDEFLAYYAEGQFADYTVAQIVKFMNDHVFATDEAGRPYPLTEQDIQGVIPSVFGDGKFDVVYQGYSMEGKHATRMLFSPYPRYTSEHPSAGLSTEYTYRLTYHDYVDCRDKERYGDPVGYRLLLGQRVEGQYDAGYYVDCLFTEDIAQRPESYPEAVYGEYYTPVREDEYGNMCMYIDHKTDRGHLTAVIPFDTPDSAQDYYLGVLRGYFDYERILDSNYQVNQSIARQVASVLDAYRNGEDPNALLPDSKTEYTAYPLETIRENPTVEEIGEILKNTTMSEDETIHFDLDLGDGWMMSLPIGIGGFGESAQAYFTGVWFVHGTPMEEENSEWTEYSETDEQTGYEQGIKVSYFSESDIITDIENDKNLGLSTQYSGDELMLRYEPFSGIVGFTPGDGSIWEKHSKELAEACDAFFNEYADPASRPPLLYYLVHKMGLTKAEMVSHYCPDVAHHLVEYLFIEDMEEAKRALMTECSFYTDGKVYSFLEVYNAEMEGRPLFDITAPEHGVSWWSVYDYLQFMQASKQQGGEYIPFVEKIINESFMTITDIADYETLGLSKEYGGTYNFLWNLLSGESDIPEYNGLGIKDYSLTRIYELNSAGTTIEFTFTVTGNSLPETLPPGTYTKIIDETVDVFLHDGKIPETIEEYEEEDRIQRGLDVYSDNKAVQAVHAYLFMMPQNLSKAADYGKWDDNTMELPYNYICKFYGNENMEISFSELQSLMSEKFGIEIERPKQDGYLGHCKYDKTRDIVYYADTRGYEPVHRIIGLREVDGVSEVTVQFFADRLYLIPSHKVVYKIGEGEVFLGCEVVETGKYKPRELS